MEYRDDQKFSLGSIFAITNCIDGGYVGRFNLRLMGKIVLTLLALLIQILAFQNCAKVSFQGVTGASADALSQSPLPQDTEHRFPTNCDAFKAQLNADSNCNTQKAAPFISLLTQQASLQGISLAGANFLGCDARNFANGQVADNLGSNLANVDGVVFFNIEGTSIDYQVNVPQRPGFLVLALMCDNSGSHIKINLKYLSPTKVGSRFLGVDSGGSYVTISGLDFQGQALFSLSNMEGSYLRLLAHNSILRIEADKLGGSPFYLNKDYHEGKTFDLFNTVSKGPIVIP